MSKWGKVYSFIEYLCAPIGMFLIGVGLDKSRSPWFSSVGFGLVLYALGSAVIANVRIGIERLMWRRRVDELHGRPVTRIGNSETGIEITVGRHDEDGEP